jgi:hypothetical protein
MTMVAAIAAFTLLSWSAWAQAPIGQDGTQQNDVAQMREQQHRRQEEFNRRMNFTDDQKQQWALIQKQTVQEIKAARMDDTLNEEQMQEKLRTIHKQNRVQVLAMLTPEQQEELKKWWEEQRAAKQQQQQQDAKVTAGSSGSANVSGTSNTTQSKASTKEDDFFAGMVQDPEPAPKSPKKH